MLAAEFRVSTPRVLVVDDNAENRALARATLEEEDYTVVLAENGTAGILAFERERPDCVLLDVRMPDLDGFVVCQRIRALPGGAETPVVFLTALRDIDTFDQALRAGADDFLTKPVRPTELLVRVQAALKLRRMSHELREQYDLVRHQRDALMRLQLQKERLSAFVVHDLKNPVTGMDLHAQVLLSDPTLPPHAKEAASQIRNEARALMRLILNLLDISKSEEGRLEAEPREVDLTKLVGEALESVEIKAKSAGVRLGHDLAAERVWADPDLLRRVLENLLDNAVRHTPRDGQVSLSTAATEAGVEIRVRDSGKGVPADLRDRIFDAFVQLGAERGTTHTGRGLGLTFCRLAIEAHAGTISVEDANPGASMRLSLPHRS
jgi:two-component system, sensor histidine kinase and response regulator